jgi:hypothetical protein
MVKEDIYVNYLLSPRELEDLQIKVMNEDKRVVFTHPDENIEKQVTKLLKRYASIYSRFAATSKRQVEHNYKDLIEEFSMFNFNKYMKAINHSLFVEYEPDRKIAHVPKPENLRGIELIVLKKALNKSGWMVQVAEKEEEDFCTFVIAPRQKEFRTDYNKEIQNSEIRRDLNTKNLYSELPVSFFYRGRKPK